jgi:chemotaxis family two-component system sensor kinase Cph1
MQSTVHQFSVQQSRDELIDLAVAAVSDITGFDRVMLYYFDSDWHGQVLAEHISEEYVGKVDSYMGLHFPATDIPKQAR